MKMLHGRGVRDLPPLDCLVAFDATLRHGVVTRAATELGLTQSAVSHRLRRLSAFVGAPILVRRGGRFEPTKAGAVIARDLSRVLDDMSEWRARARGAVDPTTLRIGVSAAFADLWLVRRALAFRATHPAIDLHLTTIAAETDARSSDLDVVVLWEPVETARASSTRRPLVVERVFPVGSPDLLGSAGGDRGPSLGLHPLIRKGDDGDGSGPEWDWSTWFARLGLGAPTAPALKVATIGPAITAAREGAGLALARSLLVHDALAEGRLARALPSAFDLPSTKVQVLHWRADLAGDPRVRVFVDWIVTEAERCLAP